MAGRPPIFTAPDSGDPGITARRVAAWAGAFGQWAQAENEECECDRKKIHGDVACLVRWRAEIDGERAKASGRKALLLALLSAAVAVLSGFAVAVFSKMIGG